jgi:hypothetical protein
MSGRSMIGPRAVGESGHACRQLESARSAAGPPKIWVAVTRREAPGLSRRLSREMSGGRLAAPSWRRAALAGKPNGGEIA